MPTKPTPPEDAMNRFIKRKKAHISKKTQQNYRNSLKRLTEFFEKRGITCMTDVDSDELARFEEWRLDNVKPITCKNDMATVRNFIQFCETINAVPVGLHELVNVTKVKEEDRISDDVLLRDEAIAILDYLKKYEYASTRHVIMQLLWKCGMRIGGLRALDVDDFDRTMPSVKIRHRPESETPLKRKLNSKREVIIDPETKKTVIDYLNENRPDVQDDHGREPLIATKFGRASRTCITKHVYVSTRPCFFNGGNCPFEKDIDDCNATMFKYAHECPGSVSPHALRRGYVTAARNVGQSKEITGDRVNMSGDILDRHYDKGSDREKAERRRDHLKDI